MGAGYPAPERSLVRHPVWVLLPVPRPDGRGRSQLAAPSGPGPRPCPAGITEGARRPGPRRPSNWPPVPPADPLAPRPAGLGLREKAVIHLSLHSLSQHGCELTAPGGGPLSRLPVLAEDCVPTPPPVLSAAPPRGPRHPHVGPPGLPAGHSAALGPQLPRGPPPAPWEPPPHASSQERAAATGWRGVAS